MAKFSKSSSPRNFAERQTINMLKLIKVISIGTDRNYGEALIQLARYANEDLHCSLKDVTKEQAIQYITDRSTTVGQSTLNKDHDAIQKMFRALNRSDYKIPKIKTEVTEHLSSRAYTSRQIEFITQHQQERNALATQIAADGGLRAHELLTLRRIEERQTDKRDKYPEAQQLKFLGRDGIRYTVQGKGGLIREVMISKSLSERLEATRRLFPVKIVDRKINYQSYYNIGGGKNFSNSFSKASNKALHWSRGAHGVRHSYAQSRMQCLITKVEYQTALQIVSQELGHFRPDITLVYLR